MNIHPYPHQLTSAPVTKPALTAGYIAFDKDGDILNRAGLTGRAEMVDDIASGQIYDVHHIWWIASIIGGCEVVTATIIAQVWDEQFHKRRGEEIPGHLQALYDITMPRGYIGQSHYVDVW